MHYINLISASGWSAIAAVGSLITTVITLIFNIKIKKVENKRKNTALYIHSFNEYIMDFEKSENYLDYEDWFTTYLFKLYKDRKLKIHFTQHNDYPIYDIKAKLSPIIDESFKALINYSIDYNYFIHWMKVDSDKIEEQLFSLYDLNKSYGDNGIILITLSVNEPSILKIDKISNSNLNISLPYSFYVLMDSFHRISIENIEQNINYKISYKLEISYFNSFDNKLYFFDKKLVFNFCHLSYSFGDFIEYNGQFLKK
ncbi:hypothetical protein JJK96_00980 [Staphylococcus haemolyticus]|uniref:hypothetical protein n=1 Tax=Staphylococcus haemolyticus TaxID=1283 RepID=UPI00190AA7EE|nr:hypothetical protein [Staphylococcus haemolyticus]MBK3954683.1 hypothetical protein [Staphylococcus haemolyticus]